MSLPDHGPDLNIDDLAPGDRSARRRDPRRRQRRTEVSQTIGKVRMASGGTRLVHSREMKVIERYSALGPEGKNLAMLLLRMGRGRLGH